MSGERVTTDRGGFNPTWQRHVAAYALLASRLPAGRIVDVGCGVGHSYELLAPRETVGVDVHEPSLRDQARETHVADMRSLPFDDETFAGAIAVQSIEHVPDPEAAIAEMERVLRPGGVAVLVTPNRLTFGLPDEIVDPYHHVEFAPAELRALCEQHFEHVEIFGIAGSTRYLELVERERETLRGLLAKDPVRLRRLVPRKVRQSLYDRLLARARSGPDPAAEMIVPADFHLVDRNVEAALDVVAVCR